MPLTTLCIGVSPHDRNIKSYRLYLQNNGLQANLHEYTKYRPEVYDVVRRWRSVLDKYGTERYAFTKLHFSIPNLLTNGHNLDLLI